MGTPSSVTGLEEEDVVLAKGGRVSLYLPPGSTIDFQAFETHFHASEWEAAVSMYRGDLLPDFLYKASMSLNAATGLIPSAAPTAGNVPDGKRLTDWVEKDLKQGLPVKVVSGDREYDDGNNPEYPASKGIHPALRLNKIRMAKKDRNKEGWEALLQTPKYRQGQGERYKIEQKFGEAKERHGRFVIHLYFSFLPDSNNCAAPAADRGDAPFLQTA